MNYSSPIKIVCVLCFLFFLGCQKRIRYYEAQFYDQIGPEFQGQLKQLKETVSAISGMERMKIRPENIRGKSDSFLDHFNKTMAPMIQFDSAKHRLTRKNTMVVWNKFNLYDKTQPCDIAPFRKDTNTAWIIAQCDFGQANLNMGDWYEVWFRLLYGRASKTACLKEVYPVDSSRRKELIRARYASFSDIEYILVVKDEAYIEPKVYDNDNFEAGGIVTTTFLYSLKNRSILAREYIVSLNTHEVGYKQRRGKGDFDYHSYTQAVWRDLVETRNRNIMTNYALKENKNGIILD